MTQAQLIADLTDDVVVAAFLASLLFIAVMAVLVPKWWHAEVNRALVTLDAGLALTLGPSVLHRLLGVGIVTSTWFSYYFLGSLIIVTVGVLWRVWIVAKTQWHYRRAAPVPDAEDACDNAGT